MWSVEAGLSENGGGGGRTLLEGDASPRNAAGGEVLRFARGRD